MSVAVTVYCDHPGCEESAPATPIPLLEHGGRLCVDYVIPNDWQGTWDHFCPVHSTCTQPLKREPNREFLPQPTAEFESYMKRKPTWEETQELWEKHRKLSRWFALTGWESLKLESTFTGEAVRYAFRMGLSIGQHHRGYEEALAPEMAEPFPTRINPAELNNTMNEVHEAVAHGCSVIINVDFGIGVRVVVPPDDGRALIEVDPEYMKQVEERGRAAKVGASLNPSIDDAAREGFERGRKAERDAVVAYLVSVDEGDEWADARAALRACIVAIERGEHAEKAPEKRRAQAEERLKQRVRELLFEISDSNGGGFVVSPDHAEKLYKLVVTEAAIDAELAK